MCDRLFEDGIVAAIRVDLVDGIEVWADPLEADPEERRWRRSPARLESIEHERRAPDDSEPEPDWDALEVYSREVIAAL